MEPLKTATALGALFFLYHTRKTAKEIFNKKKELAISITHPNRTSPIVTHMEITILENSLRMHGALFLLCIIHLLP